MTRPPSTRRRKPMVGAALLVAVLVAACSSTPSPTATPSAPAASPVASSGGLLPSIAPGSPNPSAAIGGKVAEALVATLHANPFIAHFEESILSSSLTNGTRITLTAKAVGDASGRDVNIHSSTTGGGPATNQDFVSVGDVAWFRSTGDPDWTVSERSGVAASIDQLLATVQLIDDPNLLVDTGVEELDGQSVHHLTGDAVSFHLPNGIAGNYYSFDVWATASGVPVLVKATFSQVQGINSITGGVEIHYSKVGGPITITPPAGAPTLAP